MSISRTSMAITALTFGLLLSPGDLAAQATGRSDETAPPRRPAATHVPAATRVPMIAGPTSHVLVDVRLNGKGPFRMLVDTGAATTVLDAALVEELGLPSLGTTRIGDPSNPMANEVDTVRLDSVEIGTARFEGVDAVGWRGASLTGGLARGVLGLPTFRECLLTIDYPKREIEVAPGALPDVDGKRVLPLDAVLIAELPVEVAGRTASAHLDIGNSHSLLVPGSWKGEIPTKGAESKGMGMRASGPVEFTTTTLDGDLVIGEFVLQDPEVRFDSQLEHVNVGYDVLRGFALTLDQRNSRVQLVPGEPVHDAPLAAGATGPAPTENRRRLGAALGMRADGVADVQMVAPDSPAEGAGLRAGDTLLTVDGEPATNQSVMTALEGNRPVTLVIERDGTQHTLVLFDR